MGPRLYVGVYGYTKTRKSKDDTHSTCLGFRIEPALHKVAAAILIFVYVNINAYVYVYA